MDRSGGVSRKRSELGMGANKTRAPDRSYTQRREKTRRLSPKHAVRLFSDESSFLGRLGLLFILQALQEITLEL